MLTNDHFNLILIFLYSLFFTYVAVNYFIRRLIKYGYVVEDKYKHGKKMMPTMGGIPMYVGIIVSLALYQILAGKDIGDVFIFYFIVTAYALYGIVDDIFGFRKRYDKIAVLLVLSFPAASLIDHRSFTFLGHTIQLYGFLPFVVAPVYIMVVANLVNLYAGFNGQATGLTLIMMIFAAIKSYMIFGIDKLFLIAPVLGATIVMFIFNFYPAKLHDGNSGAFIMGSALGIFLVANHLELFGILMLIPHIINFLMDTWILTIKKIPDIKFGRIRKDGTIAPPGTMRFKSIKFFLTYYLHLTEKQAVLIIYLPTIFFGIMGLML